MTGPAPLRPNLNDRSEKTTTIAWFCAAMLLVIVSAAALRYGTNILDLENVRDEYLMKVPIDAILTEGWSVDTAINYQEVKGPTFFWSYAILGKVIGSTMNDMRLITVLFFIGAAVPLLLIMVRCGASGPLLLAGAGFYVLLPYNGMVGQMLMSEPSFIFFAMWLMWVFVWGFGESSASEKRLWGPVLFAVLLSILLHHRPHAVAFAGAVALVSFERDGVRSWPWWLACIAAGLSRIPLWMHWGGLVTSDYQDAFSLGLRIECQTYLLAAVVPLTWVFLWPALRDPQHRKRMWWVAVGGGVGLVLGLLFRPDVNAQIYYVWESTGQERSQQEYAGITTTTLRTLFPSGFIHHAAIAALSTIGGAAMAAMLVVSQNRSVLDGRGVVYRLAFWTLAVGIPMYIITSGPVYDRYLQVWAILLPAMWVWTLPRWLQVVHALFLAGIVGHLVTQWLM